MGNWGCTLEGLGLTNDLLMKIEQYKLILSSYKNKRVLVTGHSGFKGSWLVSWLNLIGAKVRGYSLLPESNESLFYGLNLETACDSIVGDIRDKDVFKKAVLEFQPDFIFHLAAQPLVRKSYSLPVETYQTNVIGTGNLLESLIKYPKKCTVVLITTDKVYENKEWMYPYRELDPLGGYDPYSSSKACCEILIDSFRNSFFNISKYKSHGVAIASARAGNVIGGGDWAEDRIVPDIIRAVRSKKELQIRSPNAVRPWQHVIEPLGAYLLLGAELERDAERFAGAWNFGPLSHDKCTVAELVEHAQKIWGRFNFAVIEETQAVHEANILKLDISKAGEELKWVPKLSSKEAIDMTVNWYKEMLNGASQVELVENDINNYTNEYL